MMMFRVFFSFIRLGKSDIFQIDCVEEIGVHLNYLSGSIFIKYSFNGEI